MAALGWKFPIPKFCDNCGKPFRWTESRIEMAKEIIIKTKKLKETEKEILKKGLDELARNTPKTEIAALQFKKLANKIGEENINQLKRIMIPIISEGVKKIIFPS